MERCSRALAQGTVAAAKDSEVLPFRFSTEDVPPEDRLAVLSDVLGRVHLHLDIAPLGDGPLRVSIEQHRWGSVSACFGETSPVSAARTRELVGDGDDGFRVLFVEGAPYRFTSNGVVEEMSDGDSVLLSNSAIGMVHFLGSCRLTSVRLGHDSLMAAVRGFKDGAIQRLAPATMPLRLLSDYVERLRQEGPTADPVFAHRLANHLVDLVAMALEPTRESRIRESAGAVRAARFAIISADVLANLSQPWLSAKTIAQRHGITDRYIHLLFEDTGQTFSRFVQEQRLARAFALLTDPARAYMRIGDIALEAGFTDLSTFNRTFRSRFGDSPRGVRAAFPQRELPVDPQAPSTRPIILRAERSSVAILDTTTTSLKGV
jgi:AraC-like DNA-binding protein